MILIVDDRIENIISLKKMLEHNGFEVDSATSGNEALKKILHQTFALIILDVQMPGMDGFEVAEAVLGFSKTQNIPIIFLSAVNIDKEFIKQGYNSGGLDYITKPVDTDILILKVRTFIRLYEQNRELIAAQESLKAEVEYRKEAENKKDEFISIASHELKTPLTSIKGYLQLLDKTAGSTMDATTGKYIKRTLVQIDRLGNLVADLLDTSKIESGKLQFNKKVQAFDPLLESAIEVVWQMHPGYKIIREGNADALIFGDEVRLEQVIINYLTNAIKYSPDSNEIHFIVDTDDDMLTVRVKDFGIGIPSDKQEQIFDKFYRVEDTSHRFQGLGMGLYISAEIIRRHDGTFGVESAPGEGSVFYFSLPVYKNLENQL